MNGVVFKGTRSGIEVLFDAFAPFDTIKEDLKKKLRGNARFIGNRADVKVSAVVGRELPDNEKEELLEIFSLYFNAEGVEFVSARSDAGETVAPVFGEALVPEANGLREDKIMFVRSTLRSGQRVECEGHIIVMGDVNPGAQLVAGGNIVVLGTLRGVAHAGALGDAGSIVFALNLRPTQLRIADLIAVAPKEEQKTGYPELAHASQGKIVIEPYKPGFQDRK